LETSQSRRFSGLTLPDVNHRWLRRGALAVVFIYLLSLLPGIVWAARHMDKVAEQRIAPWDDTDYQVLAINLLHGYGFTESLLLPLEEYHTSREESLFERDHIFPFYRAPGFVFLLAGLYAVTGVSTLATRLMIGGIIWLTAVLLLLIGDRLAGWIGSLAGGMAGYFLIKLSMLMKGPEGFLSGRTLAEPLTAFLATLFALLCILYLQKRSHRFLYLACLTLAGVVLTRANFLAALPIFLIWIFFETRQGKPVLIAAILLFIPVLAWSGYASYVRQSPVLLTTQGSQDFPRFNNRQAIPGFGPEKLNQGGWQPGFARNANGELIITNANAAREGESGWLKGLQFWFSNPEKLPALFYYKLRAGLWYEEGVIYHLGIAFFLLALGLRKPTSSIRFLSRLNSNQTLVLQVGLCFLLFWMADNQFFALVLLIWTLIAAIAWLHPYGDALQSLQASVVWFVPLFAAHLISTLLFGGDERFHFPIDPLVLLFGYTGGLLAAYHLIQRDLELSLLSLLLVAGRLLSFNR
jgi:hypothetical protein